MTEIELLMPKMGESVMEGKILSWLKKEGDPIQEDEPILEIATDKVDTEIPSAYTGILKQIITKKGEIVQIGKPMAIIEMKSSNGKTVLETSKKDGKTTESITQKIIIEEKNSESIHLPSRFYSPLVKKIASQEKISTQELENIHGTGANARVTKSDLLSYIKTKRSKELSTKKIGSDIQNGLPTDDLPTLEVTDQVVPMDYMRSIISERMVASKRISAHVTSFVEADVSNIVVWKNKAKHDFKEQENLNLTYTPIFIEAVIKAIKDFPMINIQVDGNNIIKKAHINIGVAVALTSGNLIVPVIHQADYLNLVGLTREVNDLVWKARNQKLQPDDLQNGTYTVSNVGSFGNLMGTPIIVQPQVAILALGSIQKKPVVIDTPQGNAIGVSHRMMLSHSYDHRVVDGALGGMFVSKVAHYLQNFDINRKI